MSAATTPRGASPYVASGNSGSVGRSPGSIEPDAGRSWFNWGQVPGWAVSLGIHGAVLLALLGYRFHLDQEQDPAILSTLEELQRDIVFDNTIQDQVGTSPDVNELLSPGNIAAPTAEAVQQQAEASLERTAAEVDPDISLADDAPALPKEGDFSGTVDTTGGTVENVAQGGGGLEGAIDRLTWEIQQSLHEKKTTVIWLFDQSLSLKERRDAIADRFENVYRQLESLGEGGADSLNTVVATYGEKFALLNDKPTADLKPLITKVRAIANDPSGKENVFYAVGQLAAKFQRERGRGRNVRLFIVTDEKGDDAERYLEEALVLCRRGGIRVYVVGNVSPFGREKAYMNYRLEDGEQVTLDYDAGPETVEPESLNLGLWGNRPINLNLVSSGYGPYGLTRLCKETGGL
ncbi:MAG: hypothetical protein EHM42_12825, partial [Planctomycetaceae bacterium]